jgi:hypothetical protein
MKILLIMFLVFMSYDAHACRQRAVDRLLKSVDEYVQWADVIFIGEITSLENLESSSKQLATMDTSEIFKGKPPQEIIIYNDLSTSCKEYYHGLGYSYLVFAKSRMPGGRAYITGKLATSAIYGSESTAQLINRVKAITRVSN